MRQACKVEATLQALGCRECAHLQQLQRVGKQRLTLRGRGCHRLRAHSPFPVGPARLLHHPQQQRARNVRAVRSVATPARAPPGAQRVQHLRQLRKSGVHRSGAALDTQALLAGLCCPAGLLLALLGFARRGLSGLGWAASLRKRVAHQCYHRVCVGSHQGGVVQQCGQQRRQGRGRAALLACSLLARSVALQLAGRAAQHIQCCGAHLCVQVRMSASGRQSRGGPRLACSMQASTHAGGTGEHPHNRGSCETHGTAASCACMVCPVCSPLHPISSHLRVPAVCCGQRVGEVLQRDAHVLLLQPLLATATRGADARSMQPQGPGAHCRGGAGGQGGLAWWWRACRGSQPQGQQAYMSDGRAFGSKARILFLVQGRPFDCPTSCIADAVKGGQAGWLNGVPLMCACSNISALPGSAALQPCVHAPCWRIYLACSVARCSMTSR